MFRSKSLFGGYWNKPKNRLEHLKYLHNVLERNTTVSQNNKRLLVESLRCIAEILIWGDQNDSSVFDFFLEKNMLSYFLHIMRQKSGCSSFVCVQLLQTLNILFENIRNETSLYYLLSNNHVNSIIVHKFDFSDEDVMGYYILFLKTLSLKLNNHTIHFFYNEYTNDFPLYTEAIKFFNHPESMVRIAVRTISLNVYKVDNMSMLQFITDRTAAPYFSNLVWFIGKHILELDACVRNDTDHQSQSRLSNLVAEHLDHLHYLNDILCLEISDLNAVLTEHLLHKLFVPLYIFSLTPAEPLTIAQATQHLAAVLNKVVDIDIQDTVNPRVSCVVSLFLLSLVFLVITHGPLVNALAWVILHADHKVFTDGTSEILNAYIAKRESSVAAMGFVEPQESLEEALDGSIASGGSSASPSGSTESLRHKTTEQSQKLASNLSDIGSCSNSGDDGACGGAVGCSEPINITDEEKEKRKQTAADDIVVKKESDRPFLDQVLSALNATENDYLALLSLCLIYALANNKGVNAEWLDKILNKRSAVSLKYKSLMIEKLLQIINLASQPCKTSIIITKQFPFFITKVLACRIRLITLQLTITLFCQLIEIDSADCSLLDAHHTSIFAARNQSMACLRNFYKSEDIFLDLFEDEYNEFKKTVLNVEFLCMDSTILLPPTGTPLTGINFTRRLPCGEVEKARRAIRVFFYLRELCQTITYDRETMLPLFNTCKCVQLEKVLDLNNSDLIACTVVLKDGVKFRRFLVVDELQIILVEPDCKRLGCGVAKFVGFLQDIEVVGDKDDSRCLHITVHRGGAATNCTPTLSGRFVFEDHIRCMAAKQRLIKGRSRARQNKMLQIAQLLEMPGQINDTSLQSLHMSTSLYATTTTTPTTNQSGPREHRPLFTTVNRVPGVAAALRRESMPAGCASRVQINRPHPNVGEKSRDSSKNRSSSSRSRDSSPRLPRPRSEEIQMEDFRNSRNSSPVSRNSSNVPSRSHTPRLTVNNIESTSIVSVVHEHIPVSIDAEPIINNSKETSFIASKKNKRGIVETV